MAGEAGRAEHGIPGRRAGRGSAIGTSGAGQIHARSKTGQDGAGGGGACDRGGPQRGPERAGSGARLCNRRRNRRHLAPPIRRLRAIDGFLMSPPTNGQPQRRKIRVLIAKVGLDGHDVGARVVARGLLDAGMEVIYTGLRRTNEDVVRAAIEEDVDWVGVSILSGAHRVLLPRLRKLLDESGANDIRILAGGIIPQEDISELQACGVDKIFLSGTPIAEIVDYLVKETKHV